MTYVEFPTDLIVGVHWAKKKDDGGGEPPPCEPGPCGSIDHVAAPPGRQVFFLSGGLAYLANLLKDGTDSEGKPLILVSSVLRDNQFTDYLWTCPESWTVSGTPAQDGYTRWLIGVWYLTQTELGAWNPCTQPPDVLGQSVDVEGDAIVMAVDRTFSPCGYAPVYLNFTAHCSTGDGPMPPGWPVEGNLGFFTPALPGSVFYHD